MSAAARVAVRCTTHAGAAGPLAAAERKQHVDPVRLEAAQSQQTERGPAADERGLALAGGERGHPEHCRSVSGPLCAQITPGGPLATGRCRPGCAGLPR